MLRHDDAGQDAFGIHADEDLDRAIVCALERIQLRRPECQAEDGLRTRSRIDDECLEVRRIAAFGRERRGGRKQSLQLPLQLRVDGCLSRGDHDAADEEAEDVNGSPRQSDLQGGRLYRV